MKKQRGRPLTLPPWLIGPGLVIPPLFLPLLLCVAPHPVAPSLPIPRVHPVEADRHLRSLEALAAQREVEREGRAMIASWRILTGWPFGNERPDAPATRELARDFRRQCQRIGRGRGIDELLGLGDVAALGLGRDVAALELAGDRPEVSFIEGMERTGLIDQRGALRVHPLVIVAMAKANWRERCGIDRERALAPIELEALDVVLVRFGDRLPDRRRFLDERLASLDRYAERHPDYPVLRARASILLDAGQRDAAAVALSQGLESRPRDRALRNYLLFTASVPR